MHFLFKGIVIGLSIAAPVGPIGLLCIRRTLAEGRVSGFITGLGAATADMLYGAVAAFGLTAISSVLIQYQGGIRIIGALVLFYIALRIFFVRPSGGVQNDAQQERVDETIYVPSRRTARRYISAYASTFFLTLTNPSTIISFLAVFAGVGVGSSLSGQMNVNENAGAIVVGVFLGSALWWFFLTTIIGRFTHTISPKTIQWINRIAGVLMIALGLFSLFS